MKLVDLMNGYFDEKERPSRVLAEAKLPVRTKEGNDWEKLSSPNRYKKKYKFKKRSHMANFLNDVLEYEDEVQHHAEITVRYKTVTILVWTHDLNDITEVDNEYVRTVNEIYKENNATDDE
jgi:4a-hydroxytetrahydrobiopterin dehydratase